MPSYYVIVPYLSYWCNDLPNDHLYDCLMLKTNTDGTGSCIYSTPCDQQLRPVCEAVIIFIKTFCFWKNKNNIFRTQLYQLMENSVYH
jgi:hypothetical protein